MRASVIICFEGKDSIGEARAYAEHLKDAIKNDKRIVDPVAHAVDYSASRLHSISIHDCRKHPLKFR